MRIPEPSDICAVVVTYHPDPGFAGRFERLAGQVGKTVIVDNGSSEAEKELLRSLCCAPGATLIEHPTNLGIARALNTGVRTARTLGATWVMTFDDDSTAANGFVENAIRVCASIGERGLDRLGVLGANHVDDNTGKLYAAPATSPSGFIERKTVITSGSLFSLEAYEHIGDFREEFFIDGVDHEYCLRARAKGYRVLLSLEPLLAHAMGNRKAVRALPGVALETVNYTPFRWYFMVKNRLTLVTEYATKEPTWAAARAGRLVTQALTTLALEPGRLEKARCMGLGVLDFITRHDGRPLDEIERP